MKYFVVSMFAAAVSFPAISGMGASFDTVSKITAKSSIEISVLNKKLTFAPAIDSKCADPKALFYPFCFKLR